MKTVILTHPFQTQAAAKLPKKLRKNLRFINAWKETEVLEALPRAAGIVSLLTQKIDRRLLDKAPDLEAIANMAVGFDNIDLSQCKNRKIKVLNTPGVLTRATAELAATLLLAAARRVPEGELLCRTGKFKGWAPDLLLGKELHGAQALIVGKGRIGSETGKIFRGLGLKVTYCTRKDREATVHSKLKKAEILSLHLPYNEKNHHWLSRQKLQLLPKGAIVINTSRGNIVDEKSLIDFLRSGRLFSAGLDVYENEPQIPANLRSLKNVVLLPHLGSATEKTRHEMASMAVESIAQVLNGQRPRNLVKF